MVPSDSSLGIRMVVPAPAHSDWPANGPSIRRSVPVAGEVLSDTTPCGQASLRSGWVESDMKSA